MPSGIARGLKIPRSGFRGAGFLFGARPPSRLSRLPAGCLLWLFVETAAAIINEHASLCRPGDAMRKKQKPLPSVGDSGSCFCNCRAGRKRFTT